MGRTPAFNDSDDPFAHALAPPPNETTAERAARERAEARAKARSDAIDSRLKEESLARKKRGTPIRVLLLGQSESGKSTTLKNFQLTYAHKSWTAEKDAWRAVIQLNFVRSVNAIIDVVRNELSIMETGTSDEDSDTAEIDLDQDPDLMDLDLGEKRRKRSEDNTFLLASHPDSGAGSRSYTRKEKGKGKATGKEQTDADAGKKEETVEARKTYLLTEDHRALLAALSPLRAVQRELEARLGSGANEDLDILSAPMDALGNTRTPISADAANSPTSLHDITNNVGQGPYSHTGAESAAAAVVGASTGAAPAGSGEDWSPGKARALRARRTQSQEFFVRSTGWKHALSKLRPRVTGGRASSDDVSVGDKDEPSRTIYRLAGSVRSFWQDPVVKNIVKTRQVNLGDSGEFFLNELERVTSIRYSPSDDDIIRARLRTVGVQEHNIVLESGPEPGREWIIYDVGGTRSLRAQWPAYFDDVNAIIFLAPINVFDERLAEDRRINRLDDSLQLWKLVCGHRLLARTELVLFLNKYDLLDQKLKKGIKFNSYVKAYKGENEAAPVSKYLKAVFTEVCRKYSKKHRGLHVYFTSVIDTKATAKTLAAVQDGILRTNLRGLDLI